MNILYLTHHRRFKTVFRSGIFAKHLVERGHQVTVICTADTRRLRVQEEWVDGVRYVETPDMLSGKLRSGWDPWNAVQRWVQLRRVWDEADLVHAFETRPAIIHPLQLLQRRKRIPLIIDWVDWWGRGGLITELRPRWYQILFGGIETFYEEHFRSEADANTVISSGLIERAKILGVPAERIFKLTGGADIGFFKPQPPETHRSQYGLSHDDFVLGFSAMDVTMDMSLLLQAVQQAHADLPRLKVLMTGNLPPDFQEQVDSYHLRDQIIHLGLLDYEYLPQVMSCVDTFVLPFPKKPANIGRWPNKIGDYMSMGRPVISNPTGEIAQLFQRADIGYLTSADSASIANSILEAARNPENRARKGQQARQVAENHYAWPIIIDQLESCYQETVDRFET